MESNKSGNTVSSLLFRLSGMLTWVWLTAICLKAGWQVTLPIFPVFGLCVLGIMMLGYVSRAIAYGRCEGNYNFAVKKISQSPATGAPRAPVPDQGMPDQTQGPYL